MTRRFLHYYQAAAVLLLNTGLLFLLLNLAALGVLYVRDTYLIARNPIAREYGQLHRAVYPDLASAEIDQLLLETWSRPYVYDPFTHFKERPYAGAYVNVDENGFRKVSNQGPWPPSRRYYTVFVFGGSTTFGYGVPDQQTLASYLQEALSAARPTREVRVYNFGRGDYFSSQERILFEKLGLAGHVPDMALFVDGLNEFHYNTDEPLYSDRFSQLIGRAPEVAVNVAAQLAGRLPVISLALSVRDSVQRIVPDGAGPDGADDDQTLVRRVIERYLNNKRMIEAVAHAYGVVPVFVWQAIPWHRYDLAYHPFSTRDLGRHRYAESGYQAMAQVVETEQRLGKNFVWCADIQEGMAEPLYVDGIHYSARLAKMFAECVAASLVERRLLPTGSS